MGTIKRFEDIKAWQKARILANECYKISNKGEFDRDFGLKNQIRNSSGSAMDNIAEGFERDGKKEFVQFLSAAKVSAGEVRSQLYRVLDRNYIDQTKFEELYNLCIEVSKMISGFMDYLRNSDLQGTKYKELT